MKSTELVAAAGGILIGVGVGYLAGMASIENRVRRKYEDSAAAYMRAVEMSRTDRVVEAPVPQERHLIGAPSNVVEISPDLTRQEEDETPIPNHYAKAIAATETSVEMFVDGGVNDYGISYIEEDDYFEEDGRFKAQITIVMNEHHPSFFMDGHEIDDWDERVGDSILVDFYKLVPPGINQVLFVRNHKRDEDYEVIREVP